MEYLAALLDLFQSWGPSAISSFLVVVVLYLIKKIDRNSAADEQRSQELRQYINQTLNSFGDRLSVIEKEYVKNEFFYREFSGWRNEIKWLSDKIDGNYKDFYKNVIQLLSKDGKEEQ